MKLFCKRKGYFLIETSLAVFLFGIAAAMAVPYFRAGEEDRLLDASAARVTAAIYEAQALVKNGDSHVSSSNAEKVSINFKVKDGLVYYYCSRGNTNIKPRGYLPEGVTISPSSFEITFQKNRFMTDSAVNTYAFRLRSVKNTKNWRDVVVALYTGRVHVER